MKTNNVVAETGLVAELLKCAGNFLANFLALEHFGLRKFESADGKLCFKSLRKGRK